MVLRQLVSDLMKQMRTGDLLPHVERLSGYDRFQASRGIQEAAAYVADVACRIGLEDVSVEQFPADGNVHWWSYRAPVSWTPIKAQAVVTLQDCICLEVNHATRPMSLATYSSPTPAAGLTARLVNIHPDRPLPDLRGAIAVLSAPTSNGLLQIASAGAVGFIAALNNSNECSRRIELRPDSAIFGFSLTAQDLTTVQTCAEQGAQARVNIEIDRSAPTPVFTGVLPGPERSKEVWVTAHLCHPRPGANDNASGVAAALGIAAGLRRSGLYRSQKSIRLVCGPEFVGVAALMHGFAAHGRALPDGVINLDMVGENQSICGGPFIVERSPDFSSPLNALAEAVVAEVFGLKSETHEKWESAPFTGFSDHALFAGPAFAKPAVHLCHRYDRFNHSSADSLDKVSVDEMLRAAVSGAGIAYLLTNNDALTPSFLCRLFADWRRREAMAIERIAERHLDEQNGRWSREFREFSRNRNRFVRASDLHPSPISIDGELILKARWQGPFNTRAMIDDMPPRTADWVLELVAEDKEVLSLFANFAVRINGLRSRHRILKETSFGIGHPIAHQRAHRLIDAMVESCWVSEDSSTLKN